MNTIHDSQIPWELIEISLAGNASAGDSNRLEQWLSASVENRELYTAIKKGMAGPAPESRPDVERMLAAVEQRIDTGRDSGKRGTSWVQRYTWIAAAAVVVAIGVKYIPFRTAPQHLEPESRSYSTNTAQRATITLNDGTRVHLAPETRLTVSTDFGRKSRDVILQGRAVFNVDHAKGVPFTVRAGNSVTRVLGTEFDVRAYATDSIVRVGVVSGKVSLGGVVLQPGDAGTFSAMRTVVEHNVDPIYMTGWTRGELVFRDTPLGEAADDVWRMYGVTIRVADSSLAARRISGVFGERSREELVRLLASVAGARYRLEGNTVVLTPLGR